VIDDEPFVTGGLERWQLLDELLSAARSALSAAGAAGTASPAPEALGALIAGQMARLRRAGRLPMAGPGSVLQAALAADLTPMLLRWQALQAQFPLQLDSWPLRLDDPLRPGLALADGLSGLRSRAVLGATPTWVELQASPLADGKGRQPRADRLLAAWVRSLATAACGQPAAGVLIGADVVIEVAPLAPAAATDTLLGLLRALQDGLAGDRPLPTAVLTGLALLLEPAKARQAYEGGAQGHGVAEGREACLARLYPDFDALAADPTFEVDSRRLYGPYRAWLEQHVRIEPLAPAAGSAAVAED
jgi:exodeoxyribonuclease V gamma subunit